MARTHRLGALDFVMAVTVALTWGMGLVFAKAAIGHFPPILLMSFRFFVTALALVWFTRPPISHLGPLCAIAFVGSAVQYSVTYTGLAGLDASVAAVVIQLEVPFLTLLGALILKEQTGPRKWLGIGLAFFGVWQLTGEPRIATAWGSVLLVVAGAFTWSVGQVMIRRLAEIDGLTVTAWVSVMAFPQLLVISLAFETGHVAAIKSAGWVVWSAVIYLGLVMTAVGYGLWNTLIRRNPVSHVAPFLLLMPVFATLGSIAFLGERLSAQFILGGAIVLAGVALILTDRG